MSKRATKRAKQVRDMRQTDYGRIPADKRRGMRMPGSLNPRKSFGSRKK